MKDLLKKEEVKDEEERETRPSNDGEDIDDIGRQARETANKIIQNEIFDDLGGQ